MWSMPDKILKIVAGLLAACAVGGFVLGVAGAPVRGQLPGEGEVDGDGAPMAATEARALNTEELAPPKPPEPEVKEDEAEPAPEKLVPIAKPAPLSVPSPELAPPPVAAPAPAPTPPPPEDPPF